MEKKVHVIGVPWDQKSSFMKGCADAPHKIWDAFNCHSANTCAESGYVLGGNDNFTFQDNLVLSSGNVVIDEVAGHCKRVLNQNVLPIFLGGDHAITYPIIKGYAENYKRLNILHFDAHPDLYDEMEGDLYSHACPFARIMEDGLADRLVSVGIRTMNPHQKAQAERFGVEIIDMSALNPHMILQFDGPVYLSIDLDVLDPAFVPGVSHQEPGGLSTRELIRLIQNCTGDFVGADIVEYNPYRDIQNTTAMVAAKLMKEVAVKLLSVDIN